MLAERNAISAYPETKWLNGSRMTIKAKARDAAGNSLRVRSAALSVPFSSKKGKNAS